MPNATLKQTRRRSYTEKNIAAKWLAPEDMTLFAIAEQHSKSLQVDAENMRLPESPRFTNVDSPNSKETRVPDNFVDLSGIGSCLQCIGV